MKFFLGVVAFIILCGSACYAQPNIVPNPGFEEMAQCPTDIGQVTSHSKYWSAYTKTTPDFHHECHTSSVVGIPQNNFGFQRALRGKGYAGLYSYISIQANWKEYISVELPPMLIGQTYKVSMYVSLSDLSAFATNDLGIHFFDSGAKFVERLECLDIQPTISFTNLPPVKEKDSWVQLSRLFVPDSAYDHMIIGGFVRNPQLVQVGNVSSQTDFAYYYIDSVEVKLLKQIQPIRTADTLCTGSVFNAAFDVSEPNDFADDNVFILQLSSANGSFASPYELGRINTTHKANMRIKMPLNIPAGNAYRMRIVSTNYKDTVDYYSTFTIFEISPQPTASSNAPVCEGGTLQLSCDAEAGGTYLWTGPEAFYSKVPNPAIQGIQPVHEGIYTVSVDYKSCVLQDTTYVRVACNMAEVPTAFSPNGDGVNDILYAYTENVAQMQFRVYNRWGQAVFETANRETGWDGNYNGAPVTSDAVAYTLHVVHMDGSVSRKSGYIVLIR